MNLVVSSVALYSLISVIVLLWCNPQTPLHVRISCFWGALLHCLFVTLFSCVLVTSACRFRWLDVPSTFFLAYALVADIPAWLALCQSVSFLCVIFSRCSSFTCDFLRVFFYVWFSRSFSPHILCPSFKSRELWFIWHGFVFQVMWVRVHLAWLCQVMRISTTLKITQQQVGVFSNLSHHFSIK